MFEHMSHMRKNMWLTAFVVMIVGDVITTSFGTITPGIVESNPLWQSYFNNMNIFGLFFGQLLIISVGFSLDYVLSQKLGNWAFPIIPLYFIYVGTVATINNLLVLHVSSANALGVGLLISALAIGIVEFVHSRYNYPLF